MSHLEHVIKGVHYRHGVVFGPQAIFKRNYKRAHEYNFCFVALLAIHYNNSKAKKFQ